MSVHFSSESDEYETPFVFWEALNKEFNFDLDVAAQVGSAKCKKFFTPVDDGLKQSWTNHRCWMNPPYSTCGDWVEKAYTEAHKGCLVVALIPSRTDTKYFHNFIWDKRLHKPKAGNQVRFIEGRLTFKWAPASAPFPSLVVVFNPYNL